MNNLIDIFCNKEEATGVSCIRQNLARNTLPSGFVAEWHYPGKCWHFLARRSTNMCQTPSKRRTDGRTDRRTPSPSVCQSLRWSLTLYHTTL